MGHRTAFTRCVAFKLVIQLHILIKTGRGFHLVIFHLLYRRILYFDVTVICCREREDCAIHSFFFFCCATNADGCSCWWLMFVRPPVLHIIFYIIFLFWFLHCDLMLFSQFSILANVRALDVFLL